MRCPACHKGNPSGATHCEFCRTPLPDPRSQLQPTAPVSGTSVGDQSFEVGDLIAGRYLVERELGRGGMGVVYLVRDQQLRGKEMAIKFISKDLTASPQAKDRFVQEVLAAQELQHPNIIRVFHLDEVAGQNFFSMEYVPGRSLREIVEERKQEGRVFTLEECEAVLLPVLKALDHAHTQPAPVIHRDIKPDNIIVTGELSAPQVKVLDFGLAKMLSPSKLTTTAMTMGTAYYMAPEQVKGAKDVDHRADLFSVGVVLYEMLTGEVPSGFFSLPSEVNSALPSAIDEVIKKTLQQAPDKRYVSARELIAALEAVNDPTKHESSTPAVTNSKVKQTGHRSRTQIAMGGLALLALMVFVAHFAMSGKFVSLNAPSSYALMVQTVPHDALVAFTDGSRTYAPGMQLEPGSYHLTASRQGYVEQRFTAWITDHDATVEISLQKAPEANSTTYSFRLDVEPADSEVTFSDHSMSYSPGMRLKPGTYALLIRRQGYAPQPYAAHIENQDVEDTVRLEKLQLQQYRLTLHTNPADAVVRFRDVNLQYHPQIRLESGTYTLEVSKDGYATSTNTVRILDRDVVQEVSLIPLPALTVRTTPDDALVRILNIKPRYEDGIRLEPGGYTIEVSKAGYRTFIGKVEVGDRDVEYPVELEKDTSDVVATVLPSKEVSDEPLTSLPQAQEKVWHDPVTGMEFVWVPGGCYLMGSSDGTADADERPVHEVCVNGFWMGRYEVTQGEWQRIMSANPSRFSWDHRNPVENVSWNAAQEFISKLNASGNGRFRLPTEAEWEYAARSGGKSETYAGGNDVNLVAWHKENSGARTHPVGGLAPNGLGLYDMSGNVREWCLDVYDSNAYSKYPKNNPLISSGVSRRVSRGGGWIRLANRVRATYRFNDSPESGNDSLGFRLVRVE